MLNVRRLLSVPLFLFVVTNALDSSNLQVETRFGVVQGKLTQSARGRLIANFLGIPYAYPPLGDLRFRSPIAWNMTWDTPYYALTDSLMCAQEDSHGNVIGSEDCLYLNIFVPLVSDHPITDNKLPVMVYIYGGSFNTGSSDSHKYAPSYLLDQDVILVTLNYRLNALGFFSTANKASPGNYGIKDILVALQWVNENIGDFGGNPNSVTLFGHSSGATAVHHLALSDRTEGLFHRYILQSGSALPPSGYHTQESIRKASIEMARLVGCRPYPTNVSQTSETGMQVSNETTTTAIPQEDAMMDFDNMDDIERDEEMMKCLRVTPANKLLLLNSYNYIWRRNPSHIFGPTIEEFSDDSVITMEPITVIRNRLFHEMPMIIGVGEDEGLVKSIEFFADFDAEEEMISNFDLYIPYVLEYQEFVSNLSAFSNALEEFYFDGNVSMGFKNNITELLGDGLIAWPVYNAARLHSQATSSKVYFYRFSYDGTFTKTFSTGIPIHYGVAHGDDLNYLFPILNNEFSDQYLHNTEDDITMINIMTEMWANFAIHGVPKAFMIPTWPNYGETGQILRLGIGRSPEITVNDDFLPERMNFWDNITWSLMQDLVEPDVLLGGRPEETEDQSDLASSFHSNKLLIVSLVIISVWSVQIERFNVFH